MPAELCGSTASAEELSRSLTPSELNHYFCENCFPDGQALKALCSTDISEDEEVPEAMINCVVCLAVTRCKDCGGFFEPG